MESANLSQRLAQSCRINCLVALVVLGHGRLWSHPGVGGEVFANAYVELESGDKARARSSARIECQPSMLLWRQLEAAGSNPAGPAPVQARPNRGLATSASRVLLKFASRSGNRHVDPRTCGTASAQSGKEQDRPSRHRPAEGHRVDSDPTPRGVRRRGERGQARRGVQEERHASLPRARRVVGGGQAQADRGPATVGQHPAASEGLG